MRYSDAILSGFEHLLSTDDKIIVIGQGLWSPWYVGDTMRGLEERYGAARIIDTPVSEQATTGAAIGAALSGYRPIVTHPRVDFSLLALDQIVNQAAKWSSMFGGHVSMPIVFRLIVNRGGEQGAQHSQSLYSWFAHIPGLRVVLPSTPQDAQDLLVAATQSDDPVVYIDDRWLYETEGPVRPPANGLSLNSIVPSVLRSGTDATLVGASFGTQQALHAASTLAQNGIECDVIDLRSINPLDTTVITQSVQRTGRLVTIDFDWRSCGLGAEVIAQTTERLPLRSWRSKPLRVTLAPTPAPTSRPLEVAHYPVANDIVEVVKRMVSDD